MRRKVRVSGFSPERSATPGRRRLLPELVQGGETRRALEVDVELGLGQGPDELDQGVVVGLRLVYGAAASLGLLGG